MAGDARRDHEHGFTLIELLVAIGLLTIVLASLAQLFTMAIAANMGARVRTSATLLAVQKLEELRALAFGYDAAGTPRTDTTTDTGGAAPATGGPGLTPSPGGTLDRSVDGYVDHLDAFGRKTDTAGAVYTRRWAIVTSRDDPDNTLLVRVIVTRRRDVQGGASTASQPFEDVAMSVARARKP